MARRNTGKSPGGCFFHNSQNWSRFRRQRQSQHNFGDFERASSADGEINGFAITAGKR
jgi:hypothetical protein